MIPMFDSELRDLLRREVGFVPQAIAVMGKWEPFMRPERCLEEVAARAAAALAISEALEPEGPGPYFLAAEGRLRRQPHPGCLFAAEILMKLGARPDRIRCCPAANRTSVELYTLDRMRRSLGVDGLLLLTAPYHVPRSRRLLRRQGLAQQEMQILGCEDAPVGAALERLAPGRRERLTRVLREGRRSGASFAPLALNEAAAQVGERWPVLERLFADLVRGRVDPDAAEMFQPESVA
jgi:hypothetical protein